MTDAGLGALAAIVARKTAEVEKLRCAAATLSVRAASLAPAPDITAALRGGTVIAEIKRRSPSGGELRPHLDGAALARTYEAAGAAAVSVLTDAPDFGGSLDDLVAVRDAVTLAVLRKDFVIDPLQVAEARVAGADWVLLIAALLGDRALEECLEATRRAHGHALVEVHDRAEAGRAVAAGATCVGVNNRDLRTLQTDLERFAAVRTYIPADVVCVAESGVRSADDVTRLVGEGADAVLVGEAFMRADSPGETCARFVTAARAAAARRR